MEEFLRKEPRLKLDQEAYRILRLQVLERDGWRCQRCGSMKNLEVHHLNARSQLGHDCLENLIILAILATQKHTHAELEMLNASGQLQVPNSQLVGRRSAPTGRRHYRVS